jgi:putative ABC transport system permease protein
MAGWWTTSGTADVNSLDIIRFSASALFRSRLRAGLMLLAMAIGVAAVVVLTSLGEGARRFVSSEFASLGTNLLIVLPGRSETAGGAPTMFIGQTPRDLTIDDAMALERSATVAKVAPIMVGSAPVAWGGREREVPILGSTAELLSIRHWQMAQGRFLPAGDPRQSTAVCVIGAKVRRELFGTQTALGQWLRIGEWRCRIIGVLASEGRSIGVDVQELVIVPVAMAQSLFNSPSLFRIVVEASSRDAMPRGKQHILNTISARHQGEEDITVITQDAVLATFDRILGALTMTVGGIAAISLAVAGVLIMNVMLVAVSQRTTEIGLLKALGAPSHQIVVLFLSEATILSLLGAALGIAVGGLSSWVIGLVYPVLDLGAPWWAILAALTVALVSGLSFGALPARRAARLDPVISLARK